MTDITQAPGEGPNYCRSEASNPLTDEGSAPCLGEGDETARARIAPQDQVVSLRFDPEGLLDERHQVGPSSEWVPKIGLDLPEETGSELPVGSEA